VIDLTRSCSRYRPVLIDFVDRGEVRADTGAALAHLDRCTRCTEVVESTMLTIVALRRMGDEAAAGEPAADAWPRLRIRILGWRKRPAIMSPLAGVAMSFAIVAVLVLPVRLGGTLIGPHAHERDLVRRRDDQRPRQVPDVDAHARRPGSRRGGIDGHAHLTILSLPVSEPPIPLAQWAASADVLGERTRQWC
jgi:hypothetical protein